MSESTRKRYLKNWVADAQLEHYMILGAITQEQANEIKGLRI